MNFLYKDVLKLADESKVSKRGIGKFFKEMKAELKKVIWPDRKQLTNNTITVILACLIVGSFIWIMDFALGEVATRFLFK